MNCLYCGKEVVENSKVCMWCGANLENANQAAQQSANNCANPYNPMANPYMQGVQKSVDSKATTSMVLGIIGLFVWIFPLFGFPVNIIGLVFGIQAQKGSKKGMAIAGLVMSAIGLVLTAMNSFLGAYMGATGQLF